MIVDRALGTARTRGLAAALGERADALLCMSPENIYFLTGFRTMLYTRFTAALVRFDTPEEPVLIASSVDRPLIEERVWSPPWTENVAYHGTHPGLPATPEEAVRPYLRGVRRLAVDSIRLADAVVLERAAPGISLAQAAPEVDAAKQHKTPAEVEMLRRANRLALDGITCARDLIAAGPVTEIELAVELDARARRAGADGFGYPTLVSCGAKMLAVHSPALARPVQPHQPLRIAHGPSVDGYTADVVRTLCLGTPPAELVRLQDAFLEARDALLERIRPGAAIPSLMAAVRETYERRGVASLWRNNIGHGVGLSIHEPPRIGGSAEGILTEDMVVALEPNLMVDGMGGYAHCDVVRVAAPGPELLTPDHHGIVRAG
jgi:Xaa-Pro aminopeptidase